MPTWRDRFLSSDAARLNPKQAERILARFEGAREGGNLIAHGDGGRPGLRGSVSAAGPQPTGAGDAIDE